MTHKQLMELSEAEFDAWCEKSTAQEVEAVLLEALKDPQDSIHALIPTYRI